MKELLHLVYRFIDSDTNPSNDVGIYTFHLTQNLVDVIFDAQENRTVRNLAVYNDNLILNTDTDYVMEISGVVSSCPTCNLEADLGWRLIGQDGMEKANSTITYTNLPDWGTVEFTRDMPPLNHDTEGVFELEFGILGLNWYTIWRHELI